MKSSAIALGLGGALSGFIGAGVALFAFSDHAPSAADSGVAPAPRAAAPSDTASKVDAHASMMTDADAATLAQLNRRIDLLETELASLRSDRSRQAVNTNLDVAKAAPTPDVVAEIQREAIVQVLEEQKQAELDKREQERKERQVKQAQDMAARAAKELGLGAGDEARLADFIVVAGDKRDEMFKSVREGGTFDRDTMRQNFDDYRTWAEGELNNTFGANVGGQILEYQRKQRDGFGGFGGGFGGGPPGGFGGGTNGATGGGDTGGRGRGARGGG